MEAFQRTERQGTGYENYSEFDNEATGSTINLTATVNGTSLKDIFDRLLVEKRQDDIEPLAEPTGPEPRTGPENDLVNGRLKDLPAQVQNEIKKIADQIITELSASRVVVNQDTHERAWEGPEWYRHLIDADRKVGGKGDDLKGKYMSALQSIASGRDKANPEAAAEMKQIIIERATGQSEIESNLQPAILRYMGDNETLFRVYGDQILSSEKPQLEATFGADWEKVLDEYLM